ncbi:MAG: hypothetical protein V8Q17_01525 [Acutalibacteraceae bacterium]
MEIQYFSGGQKILIVKSLCQPSYLLVWDESLNDIDVNPVYNQNNYDWNTNHVIRNMADPFENILQQK